MKYLVEGQLIKCTDRELIVEGSQRIYNVEFEFSDAWEGFTKVAVFKRIGDTEHPKGYPVDIVDDVAPVPIGVLEFNGSLIVGVCGILEDKVMPKVWSDTIRIHAGVSIGEAIPDPDPTVYEQIMSYLSEVNEKLDGIKSDVAEIERIGAEVEDAKVEVENIKKDVDKTATDFEQVVELSKGEIKDEKDAAISAVCSEATKAVVDIGNAKNAAVGAVDTAGNAAIAAVNIVRDNGITAVNIARDAAITEGEQALEEKTEEQLERIPEVEALIEQVASLNFSLEDTDEDGYLEMVKEGGEPPKPELKIVTWADGTWEEIAAMLDAHYRGDINVADYWAVGDVRVLYGSYNIAIYDFAHDTMPNGIATALTVGIVNLFPNDTPYANISNYIDTELLPLVVFDNVRDLIKVVEKKVYTYEQGVFNIQTRVFVPSTPEVFSSSEIGSGYNKDTGFLYEYFTTAANRQKKRVASNANWWLRDEYSSSKACIVSQYGGALSNITKTNGAYIAATFCL